MSDIEKLALEYGATKLSGSRNSIDHVEFCLTEGNLKQFADALASESFHKELAEIDDYIKKAEATK